jgi:hypothetical protein
MGAVPLPWAFVTAAARDGCCSRLIVVELSAATAYEDPPAWSRAEDKQPTAPITSTLVDVFIVVPPGKSRRWMSNQCARRRSGAIARKPRHEPFCGQSSCGFLVVIFCCARWSSGCRRKPPAGRGAATSMSNRDCERVSGVVVVQWAKCEPAGVRPWDVGRPTR